MPNEKTVPVTSQVVRELVRRVWYARYGCAADEEVAAALIQSHIDQVVAPLREAIKEAYEEGWSRGFVIGDGSVTSTRDEDWEEYAATSILSASPIPGAKAEETASAEFLRDALEQALSYGVSPRLPDDEPPMGYYDEFRAGRGDDPETEEEYELRCQRTKPYGDETVEFFSSDENMYPHHCPELATYLRTKEQA